MVLIIGFDPGLRKTGWGVIESNGNKLSFVACGSVSPSVDLPMSERLLAIHAGVGDVLDKYKLDEAAIEEVFVNKNAMSSLKLGQARGALMLSVSIFDMKIYEYSTLLVKKSVVGTGSADKNQVQRLVEILLPGAKMKTHDESDALAVAICHAHLRNSIRY